MGHINFTQQYSDWSANIFEYTESYSIWKKTPWTDEPHLVERPVVIMCESFASDENV